MGFWRNYYNVNLELVIMFVNAFPGILIISTMGNCRCFNEQVMKAFLKENTQY